MTKPPVHPIGVPGAMLPLQMTPDHLKSKILASPQSTPGKKPEPVNKPGARDGEFDVSTELSGYGLQGVMATEAELADLVAELGLDGDEAGDLVKGLAGGSSAERGEKGKQEIETKEDSEELKDESKEKEPTAEVKELKEPPAKSPEESLTESSTISPQTN